MAEIMKKLDLITNNNGVSGMFRFVKLRRQLNERSFTYYKNYSNYGQRPFIFAGISRGYSST